MRPGWVVGFGVLVAACGGGRGETRTCEAWTEAVRSGAGPFDEILGATPHANGVSMLTVWGGPEPAFSIFDLTGSTRSVPVEAAGEQWSVQSVGEDLIVARATDSGARLVWTRIAADGSLTESALDTPGEAVRSGPGVVAARSVFLEDFSVHMHQALGEQGAAGTLSLSFQGPDGQGGAFSAVGEDGGLVDVHNDGATLMRALNQQGTEVEVVDLDTTGDEIGRWTLTWPESYAWHVGAHGAVELRTADALIRMGPDGELARTEVPLLDERGFIRHVGLVGDDLLYEVKWMELPSGRHEIWVRSFDADLNELAPGPTLLWASHGVQSGGWHYRVSSEGEELAFVLDRRIVESSDDAPVWRQDVARMRCTGRLVPLSEVSP